MPDKIIARLAAAVDWWTVFWGIMSASIAAALNSLYWMGRYETRMGEIEKCLEVLRMEIRQLQTKEDCGRQLLSFEKELSHGSDRFKRIEDLIDKLCGQVAENQKDTTRLILNLIKETRNGRE